MEHFTISKNFMRYAGIFLLVVGFTGCSDDDIHVENGILELPTGVIYINDWETLSGSILTVPSVRVGQDSWLAAVKVGDEGTNNFIAQPVLVRKGTSSNVTLHFVESVVNYSTPYAVVVLKLYVENLKGGIRGEWDESDKPIVSTQNELILRTITIEAHFTEYNLFRDSYDLNGDQSLDLEEFSKTYPNHFQAIWDADKDGYLNREEFYNTQFLNTDSNRDGKISIEEWEEGYLRMFRKWTDKDFFTYDTDNNRILTRNEWNKGFEESEWFKNYDINSDNLITEQELTIGFFKDWDLNEDGKIDEAEFNNYHPYVIPWEWYYWHY